MNTDDHIRVMLGGRQYAAVPTPKPKQCIGCVFGPIDSQACERGKSALDDELRALKLRNNACATYDTIFIRDTPAGWNQYLHEKIVV